ncbi:unnamed protein product [Cuscuta europaea]|nr:unnamed protein product [Cuscuta europaea]
MVSTLHALFANRYRANFSNLRIAAQDKFIDYAKGQDLDCTLVMPFRPEFESPDIWHDLCILGKLKHNHIAILGEGEVPVMTMGRRSKSRRLDGMESRETQERNSHAEALMARNAELRIEFEVLMTMQHDFKTQISNIWSALVSMGVVNPSMSPSQIFVVGGSSSQNQPSSTSATNVQAATTSAANVQAATTSAANVQAATTSAANVQAATTSAANVQAATTSAANVQAATTSAANVQAATTSAANVQAATTSAANVQAATTSAANVQAATTSAANVQAATTSAANVQAATTSATNVQAATTSATDVGVPTYDDDKPV